MITSRINKYDTLDLELCFPTECVSGALDYEVRLTDQMSCKHMGNNSLSLLLNLYLTSSYDDIMSNMVALMFCKVHTELYSIDR